MAVTITDRDKIKNLFEEGIQTMSDVESLNQGLNDTIKAIADELQIKPAVLKKALKIEYKRTIGKGSIEEEQEAMSEIESILVASGRVSSSEF